MASLKYIMGMVTEEMSESQASTEPEEISDYEAPQVERKEATPEPSSPQTNLEENDIEDDHELDKSYQSSMETHSVLSIENELICQSSFASHTLQEVETEDQDASSLSSMVAHQQENNEQESPPETVDDWNFYITHLKDTTLVDKESFFHIESSFYITLVSHQQPPQEITEEEYSQISSLVVHQYRPTDIEDSDPASMISLTSHMINRNLQDVYENEQLQNVYGYGNFEGEILLKDTMMVENEHEKEIGSFSEQIEYQISSPSVVDKENASIDDLLDNEMYWRSYDRIDVKTECLHPLTMVSHQLSIKDTPTNFDENLVSSSCHKHLDIEADDQDTLSIPSMFVHQMQPLEVKINASLTDISDILAYEKYVISMTLYKYMESLSSSMVCHKLDGLETLSDPNELILSMAAHSSVPVDLEEKDTACLPSMCAHQINLCYKSNDGESEDYQFDYKNVLVMPTDKMIQEEKDIAC